MKKLLVLFLFIFLIISCEQNDYIYNIHINNNSDHNVSFYFNENLQTLPARTSYNFGKAGINAITNIRADNDEFDLKINYSHRYTNNYSDIIYTISNAPVYKLNIDNNLSVEVVISAENFIDYLGSTEVTVSANETVSDIIIYTNNPNFTILSDDINVDLILKTWTFNSEDRAITLFLR